MLILYCSWENNFFCPIEKSIIYFHYRTNYKVPNIDGFTHKSNAPSIESLLLQISQLFNSDEIFNLNITVFPISAFLLFFIPQRTFPLF